MVQTKIVPRKLILKPIKEEQEEIKKPMPVAFGSGARRFTKTLSSHPKLDPSGLYIKRPLACDPCLYKPIPIYKIYQVNRNKSGKDPWRYKSELEEWSAHLGYRNQEVLEVRRWQATLLGPAWHKVKLPKKYEPACKNVGFGRTPRTLPDKNDNPGPGTYYKEVPYKAPYGPHSKKPTFEREDPCRFRIRQSTQVAPNRYNIIDPESIDMKPRKLVSLRGPYDLFTGKRDDSTIKNHFGKARGNSLSSWPLALKGCFETYKHSHFGTMNKTNRSKPYRGRNALEDPALCMRSPDEPGPATYTIEKERTFKENKYGFNSSYDRPRGYQRIIVWPGVGRYSIKKMTYGELNLGHRHVFISKIGRTIGSYLPEPMNTF